MLNSNKKMLGIIFPNSYDSLVSELVNVRMMASIPFASRYRLIDFLLSSMTNCGIDNVSVLANNNYHSLMDHLESGRAWDLVRKNGGLHIFPPFAEKTSRPYTNWVGGLASIIGFLRSQKEKYVVLTNANMVVNYDFKAMLEAHIESGADVTMAYNEQEVPESVFENLGNDKGFFYTFEMDGGRVKKLYVNPREKGIQKFCMQIAIIERELLIRLVEDASVHGLEFLIRDVILPQLGKLNVQGYKYDGYVSYIHSLKSYFDENMRLLDDHNLEALFSTFPVYTKIRDDTPTRYIEGSKVQNVMVADGCVIEGEVEDSVVFRGVSIAKGAKVKNCILMQGTVVESGANIEYLITDKSVTVTAGKEMKGTDTFPVYIGKNQTV
ncbi:MAG: glucose-1-phosphate adenylyltransferase subunit GlgD [Eubacterium sp.]|nr:glucose-1-phosphate adenylyltransferase subunit GlgD [Eubacterium sp.]MCI8858488.1 glucose-1-phosphate adenylyltransferase subunit GlgD [Lachnospiraceae bacterium]